MVDLQDLTLIQLFRLLKLRSWLWVVGIGAGIFAAGLGFAVLIGVAAEPADITRANNALNEEQVKNKQLQDKSNTLGSELAAAKQSAEEIESNLESCLSESADFQQNLEACQSRLNDAEATLWLVHQGDGNGYPQGNNGIVANHDDRANWDSSHYRSESCLQKGGPRIDSNYAARICGSARVVGPFGVLDVNGGTCGHGMYVIACLGS